MNRGKFLFLSVLIFCLFAVSCEKTGSLCGSYTYKTSGVVYVVPTISLQLGEWPLDTTYYLLKTEQGQMNISRDNSSDGLVISWNDIVGDVCTAKASASGKQLILSPSPKKATINSAVQIEDIVTFSGTGERFDNQIVFPLEYEGKFNINLVSMTIVDSDVTCVAKANPN